MASSPGGAYLDSSALVKLIAEEAESEALRSALEAYPFLASCELSLTEVRRAVDRKWIGQHETVQRDLLAALDIVLGGLDLVPLDRTLLEAAGALTGAWMRALDAIHVTAALTLGDDLSAFVTYDERQAEAAGAHDLLVRSPGR